MLVVDLAVSPTTIPDMNRGLLNLLVMGLAATFEVGGDALIRKGLRSAGPVLIVVGFLVLGTYVFHDVVPRMTWVGLAVILAGSLIIHVGSIAK
jgi:drug/metabolite transporter (DMT)-like permease